MSLLKKSLNLIEIKSLNGYRLVPTTCQSLASTCPAYRLLERRKEYDIRWYPSHRWVSAIVMTEDDRLLAVWEGLSKLQDYFDGHNDVQTPMNLTFPLLTQVKHGKHPGVLNQELRDITLSAPIPARYQINPPTPNSADVSVFITYLIHQPNKLWLHA